MIALESQLRAIAESSLYETATLLPITQNCASVMKSTLTLRAHHDVTSQVYTLL